MKVYRVYYVTEAVEMPDEMFEPTIFYNSTPESRSEWSLKEEYNSALGIQGDIEVVALYDKEGYVIAEL